MFSKISNMLGKVWDAGSNLIKPMKNHISNGWEMLKNGASKVGRFVSNNHEAIGSILSGVGNIIGNLPNSPIKDRLTSYGNTSSNTGNVNNQFGRTQRPQNTQRQPFGNNLNNRYNTTPQNMPVYRPKVSYTGQSQQPRLTPKINNII